MNNITIVWGDPSTAGSTEVVTLNIPNRFEWDDIITAYYRTTKDVSIPSKCLDEILKTYFRTTKDVSIPNDYLEAVLRFLPQDFIDDYYPFCTRQITLDILYEYDITTFSLFMYQAQCALPEDFHWEYGSKAIELYIEHILSK